MRLSTVILLVVGVSARTVQAVVTPATTTTATSVKPPATATPEQFCRETYTVKDGDSCSKIANKFALTLCQLRDYNSFLNCCNLYVGTELCLSLSSTCEYRHEVVAGDSCASIANAYKLTTDELTALNNNSLNCSSLLVGRMLCVRPEDTPPVPNFQCTQSVTGLAGNWTCLAISRAYQITVDELLFINPQLKCNALSTVTKVCVRTSISQTCSAFAPISSEDTCESLMAEHGVSEMEFYRINPFIRCDKLRRTSEVCIGQGYFHADKCVETLRVTGTNLNCSTLAAQLPIDEETLRTLNPFLNCSGEIVSDALVCVHSLGGLPTTAARDKLFNALKVASPLLAERYSAYKTTPDASNTQAMYAALTQEMLKPGVYSALKKAYLTDATIRKMVDSEAEGMNRTEACEDVRRRGLSSMIVNCVCNKADLLVYCSVLAANEFANVTRNSTDFGMRRKRSGPSFAFSCAPTFPTVNSPNTVIAGCIGGGCTIPLPPSPIELRFRLQTCMPPMRWMASNMLGVCELAAGAELCDVLDTYNMANEEDVVGILQTVVATGSISVCIVGSDVIVIDFLKKFGLTPCWDLATVSYAFFTGSLKISTSIYYWPIKITLSFNLKVHDLVYPPLCAYGRYECQDYCVWQQDNEPAGAWTGTIRVDLFGLFGFDGWNVYKDVFKPPGNCYPGQVFIDVRNERTCANYSLNLVHLECFGTGKIMKLEQDISSYGFSFKFLSREQTQLACKPEVFGEFLGGPTVCIYGVPVDTALNAPRAFCNGDRVGKGTYYYVIRNDGVYFGRVKGQETEKVGTYIDVCEDKEDFNKLVASMEPTGISDINNLRCGKRRVAYYTGWGARTITETQLRQLTHVIFAFVGMRADGSLYFHDVVQDELGIRRSAQASRFKYMRELARVVTAGVHVMVAIGGWEDSQYFSAICRDQEKRWIFVNNIVDFIAAQRIDGVDIDWEYPVTGGAVEGIPADKYNFVLLVYELRDRLTQLQQQLGRKSAYVISIASAAGDWTIRPGYDLNNLLLFVDFFNVMSYDYYGAWEGANGAFTGPPAPLFAATPEGFSGKLNVHYTMKYYTCVTKRPEKLNMGIPFYGRYWENVGDAIDPADPMWRIAQPVDGKIKGGYVGYRDLQAAGFPISFAMTKDGTYPRNPYLYVHQQSQSHYWWNPEQKRFLGLETPITAIGKAFYALHNRFGGLMVWALDLDADNAQFQLAAQYITMLDYISSVDMCQNISTVGYDYDCTAIDVGMRWWTGENSGPGLQGTCGRSAQLINGYYPVCDPEDAGYSCCGPYGYCGAGPEYCDCPMCVNYGADPKKLLEEPIQPTRSIQWYFTNAPDGQRGRCGPQVPKLNGKFAICNPDDANMHCCSSGGYCGNGAEYCTCAGCVDFAKNPNFMWSA
ncbi:Protein T01C4.1 [Aphelenchoides avenae]|nr:Protein T01C4.1 [Aphelenchus avenae]